MKGTQGLVIAAGLGILGAACNWFYLARKAKDLDKEEFIYVKKSARIREGDVFKEEHFGKVAIPRKFLGNLEAVGVPWDDLNTVVGQQAIRSYSGDHLLLRQDLKTPPQRPLDELLGKDEVSWNVLVDSTTFIPQNHNPGEKVLFFPPPAVRVRGQNKKPIHESGVGPFRILRIGSRGGSYEVQKATGRRDTRSNVLVIPLKRFKSNDPKKKFEYDEKSRQLLELQEYAGGQGLSVAIQSAQAE